MAQGELWVSAAMFRESRRRTWPYEPTRLEILAIRLGLEDEELHETLREQVQRRLRERGEPWDCLDRTFDKREHGR